MLTTTPGHSTRNLGANVMQTSLILVLYHHFNTYHFLKYQLWFDFFS